MIHAFRSVVQESENDPKTAQIGENENGGKYSNARIKHEKRHFLPSK